MDQKMITNGTVALVQYDIFCQQLHDVGRKADLSPEQLTTFVKFGTGILFGQMLINVEEQLAKEATKKTTQ